MSKEKRSEIFHDALKYLDDEMIEDVERLRGFMEKEEGEHGLNMGVARNSQLKAELLWRKTSDRYKPWKKWTALAASICLLFIGSWIYNLYIQPANDTAKPADTNQENIPENKTDGMAANEQDDFRKENDSSDGINRSESSNEESDKDALKETASPESIKSGVVIPKMEVSLKNTDDLAADMLGFFILNGRSYIQYELHQDYVEKGSDFVGDYAGHITGMIDEWTETEGYVEGAGTCTGNVYEVKGVSPDFMLCMVWENGWVETFINHNDLTLYKGSDLVDDWLDLRGNYDSICLETRENDQSASKTLELTEEEMNIFDRFLDAFAEADYIYINEKAEQPFGDDKDTSDKIDFYYIKENGVRVRFRTLGDGYVSFPWINACVKIEQNIYDELADVLKKQTK